MATPIGNLEDVSPRALRILSEVDLILAEDTRVTKKLLDRYGLKTPLLSYHQHSQLSRTDKAIELLRQGKNLALVSDAGTPGISDPGNSLVKKVVESLGAQAQIFPVPGPSALVAAASVAGFPMDKFLFLGFPPTKNKRKKFFETLFTFPYPVIFYESTHRILKALKEMSLIRPEAEILVGQELTKKFERTYRGKIAEVAILMEKSDLRGEFVVIVRNSS